MPTKPVHKPAGIPEGGQFAATAHSDEVPSLAAKPVRPAETLRRLRGHNFYPSAREMEKWPPIYTNDSIDLPDQPIVAHYFQGGADWWVTEYDPERNQVFGFAQLAGHGRGEWGYSSLTEIEQLRGQFGLPIERELDFKPGTLAKECIPQYVAEEAERKAEEEANAASSAALAAAAEKSAGQAAAEPVVEDDDERDFDWPEDEGDPLSPEDRAQWDSHHRFAYNYAASVLGTKGFESRDQAERFAGFAANAYMDSGWDGMMDIHGVVDDWHAQEYPNG
ncbi:DUF2958 domain-containing protein [Pseudarthrobacter sp. BIM B-2242]|uniref:DUF2958 domain-containing protein n=1 Tax=Pseudarthrobacter sp. BIM B-2242 TaxID=2772401 RepID=UPI00168BF93A|nr:DUF2958 domain-containing protein [Pseudarthrobacter sp. BIM B-2242]QOD05880.1 DUF2958 domain-containing protein [Pseudarthrobacter sp. BIM B-2242]